MKLGHSYQLLCIIYSKDPTWSLVLCQCYLSHLVSFLWLSQHLDHGYCDPLLCPSFVSSLVRTVGFLPLVDFTLLGIQCCISYLVRVSLSRLVSMQIAIALSLTFSMLRPNSTYCSATILAASAVLRFTNSEKSGPNARKPLIFVKFHIPIYRYHLRDLS